MTAIENTCDHCGADVEHPFTCRRCKQRFCGDHRLPENHGCPGEAVTTRTFGGNGPTISDRRSTKRKRVERVRDKETDPSVHRRQPEQPEESSSDSGDNAILTCPSCGESTARTLDCQACGETMCPACRHSHNDSIDGRTTAPESESESTASSRSLLDRVRDLLM